MRPADLYNRRLLQEDVQIFHNLPRSWTTSSVSEKVSLRPCNLLERECFIVQFILRAIEKLKHLSIMHVVWPASVVLLAA